jgi:hypothetical protein
MRAGHDIPVTDNDPNPGRYASATAQHPDSKPFPASDHHVPPPPGRLADAASFLDVAPAYASAQHHQQVKDEQPTQPMEKTMAYLLGLPVGDDGNEVLVFEVDPSEVSDDLVLAAPPEPGQIIAKAQVTLEQALAKLKPSLQKIMHMLKELSPDETEVEFGLKIGGETGVIIAKGTAEVNFTIRMSWRNQ